MDIVNILIAAICLAVIIGGVWLQYGGSMTRPDVDFHQKRFSTVLLGLKKPEREYQFFEQAHLIWVETTPEFIRRKIRKRARSQPGINSYHWISPTFFHFKVEEHRNSVYFAISDQTDFDWNCLSRCDDAVRSQRVE